MRVRKRKSMIEREMLEEEEGGDGRLGEGWEDRRRACWQKWWTWLVISGTKKRDKRGRQFPFSLHMTGPCWPSP